MTNKMDITKVSDEELVDMFEPVYESKTEVF